LAALLASLVQSSQATGVPLPPLCLIDDRQSYQGNSDLAEQLHAQLSVTVIAGGGRGPAAARNLGWRDCDTPWVAFLDDDVVVTATWLADLMQDLESAGRSVGGVQGRITVPLPSDRGATDWERNTAGLQTARWITADMAYRTEALRKVGGFDERFTRAFREDADLALTGLRPSPTSHALVLAWVGGSGRVRVETVTDVPVRCMNRL
jgi:glycosyltransferase involved in cell wall biosynthesis